MGVTSKYKSGFYTVLSGFRDARSVVGHPDLAKDALAIICSDVAVAVSGPVIPSRDAIYSSLRSETICFEDHFRIPWRIGSSAVSEYTSDLSSIPPW